MIFPIKRNALSSVLILGSAAMTLGGYFMYMSSDSVMVQLSYEITKKHSIEWDDKKQEQTLTLKKDSSIMQNYVKQWLNETNTPPTTPGAFIHIGKTGGSTLSTYLRNSCHSFVPKPCPQYRRKRKRNLSSETVISKLTTYYHTPDFPILGDVRYQFYVITLRDPLSKFKSIFTYLHPSNIAVSEPRKRGLENLKKLYSCFPNLEEFAKHLSHHPPQKYREPDLNNLTKEEDCANLAQAIMLPHKFHELDHYYWGISTIHKKLEQSSHFTNNATILVIRAEHIWKDWQTANEYLGDPHVKTYEKVKVRDYAKLDLPVNKDISEAGQKQLCFALRDEYDRYLQLLQLSSNLDSSAKRESLDLAQKHCPWLHLTLSQ